VWSQTNPSTRNVPAGADVSNGGPFKTRFSQLQIAGYLQGQNTNPDMIFHGETSATSTFITSQWIGGSKMQ